jgi:formate hydrogenlyase subunit 3/multisubunit Na+/H+ antiporter MnhD subunit
MDTQTLILAFFALSGAGVLLTLAASKPWQAKVLGWLGCLASLALLLAGGNALLAGNTFDQPLWSLPGLATITVKLDGLSAAFLIVTGFVLFPASIFAANELNQEPNRHGGLFAPLMSVRTIIEGANC